MISGNDVLISFHEKILGNNSSFIKVILNYLNHECDMITTFNDYFKDDRSVIGFGEYDPFRSVLIDDEIDNYIKNKSDADEMLTYITSKSIENCKSDYCKRIISTVESSYYNLTRFVNEP